MHDEIRRLKKQQAEILRKSLKLEEPGQSSAQRKSASKTQRAPGSRELTGDELSNTLDAQAERVEESLRKQRAVSALQKAQRREDVFILARKMAAISENEDGSTSMSIPADEIGTLLNLSEDGVLKILDAEPERLWAGFHTVVVQQVEELGG